MTQPHPAPLTLDQALALSDEQIRARVAEIAGWVLEEMGWAKDRIMWVATRNLPDYPYSHDALAPVIAAFHGKAHPSAVTDEERHYRDMLAKVLKCAWYDSARLILATPRQKAVALILAKI